MSNQEIIDELNKWIDEGCYYISVLKKELNEYLKSNKPYNNDYLRVIGSKLEYNKKKIEHYKKMIEFLENKGE